MCLRSDILDDKMEHRLSICGVHERFSYITIPKRFCFETCLIVVSPTFNSRLSKSFTCFLALINMYVCLFVCFVALRPKSTAMVIAGRSVHLTTLIPGQA